MENNNQQLTDLRNELNNLVSSCETLYEKYADKRDAVLQLKAARKGSWGAPASAWEAPVADSWGAAPTDAWGAEPAQEAWAAAPAQDSWAAPAVTSPSSGM